MCPIEVTPSLATTVTREVLPNGLTVVVQEVHTAPLVSVWCWYRVGSGDEALGQSGISHWVEHMNFKGTAHIARDEMKGIIERLGGMWNGYTWIDQTTYMETAIRDALDTMLYIEAERMTHGLFDPFECESERTVVISELQGGENDPEQLLDIELTATALRVHPYRHPTIGWLQDLQTITRDDLYAHYRRHYVPSNAVLVIVGDVRADEVLRKAERQFGGIPDRPVRSVVRQTEPPQIGERRVVLEREGTTAYLRLAYPAPAATDPAFAAALVLDAVLTGAKGVSLWSAFRGAPPQRKATLYTTLVEQGLATSVSGSLLPTKDPFLYTVALTAADGVSLAAVEEAVLRAIQRVSDRGATEAEVARAKHQLQARMVFETDSVTNIAHQLGYFETVAGAGYLDDLPRRIGAVTAEDVWNVAREWLVASRRTVGLFRPHPFV